MLRIPGSYNSKHGHTTEVKILHNWDGIRLSIKPLLTEFYVYLADAKIKEIHRNRKSRKYSVHYGNNHKIPYVEMLLQIPISESRIVAPYLINIRKLSYDHAASIIREWLDKCDKLKPLVGVNDRIKPNLNAAVRKGYLPISFSDLKTENGQLADLIACQLCKFVDAVKPLRLSDFQ